MKSTGDSTINIGIRERKIRRILGIVFLVVSVVLTYFFVVSNMNFRWGLILFPVWYQGIRFLYDYSTGTCPLKAELGQSRIDAFISVFGEPLQDKELAQRIKTKSRKAIYRAVAAAFLLTALTVSLMAAF